MGSYHLPVRPYSPIDALNRRAAAVGSLGYAKKAANTGASRSQKRRRYWIARSSAEYNGHHVSLSWNNYRHYYIAEYWWAGRHVLARGTFGDCLAAAVKEWHRGALGSSVSVCPRDDDAEADALCQRHPDLVPGALPKENAWYTWRHEAAAASVRDYANPGRLVLRFDWELMRSAVNRDAYKVSLADKYGSIYH